MTIASIGETITMAFNDVIERLIAFIPDLVAALVILIVGWIIGVLLGAVVDKGLRVVGLKSATEKSGLDPWLSKIGIKMDSIALLGALVKWVTFIIAFISAVEVLQLTAIKSFLDGAINYVPSVIAAAAILLIGGILANFLSEVVRSAVAASEIGHEKMISAVIRYSVWIFTFIAALVQLGIATNLLQILFTGLVGMLAIAGGLAFGLGGKDLASKVLDKVSENIDLQ